jgi:hypothetical protein
MFQPVVLVSPDIFAWLLGMEARASEPERDCSAAEEPTRFPNGDIFGPQIRLCYTHGNARGFNLRDALKLSPDQLVRDAVANSRLEGFDVSEETRIILQRVANGELSLKELETWENEQAERIKVVAGL